MTTHCDVTVSMWTVTCVKTGIPSALHIEHFRVVIWGRTPAGSLEMRVRYFSLYIDAFQYYSHIYREGYFPVPLCHAYLSIPVFDHKLEWRMIFPRRTGVQCQLRTRASYHWLDTTQIPNDHRSIAWIFVQSALTQSKRRHNCTRFLRYGSIFDDAPEDDAHVCSSYPKTEQEGLTRTTKVGLQVSWRKARTIKWDKYTGLNVIKHGKTAHNGWPSIWMLLKHPGL